MDKILNELEDGYLQVIINGDLEDHYSYKMGDYNDAFANLLAEELALQSSVLNIMACFSTMHQEPIQWLKIFTQVRTTNVKQVVKSLYEGAIFQVTCFVNDEKSLGVLIRNMGSHHQLALPVQEVVKTSDESRNIDMIGQVANIGAFEYDYHTKMFRLNDKAKVVLGFKSEEKYGALDIVLERFIPEDRDKLINWLLAYRSNQHSEGLVLSLESHIGEGTLYVSIRPILLPKSRKTAIFMGTILDITKNYLERIKTEETIYRSRLSARAAKLTFFKYDYETDIQTVDNYWFELVGLNDYYENIQPYYLENIYPDDFPSMIEAFKGIHTTKEYRLDFRFYKRDEEKYIWLRKTAVLLEKKEKPGQYMIIGTYQNIDDEKTAEEEMIQLTNMLDVGMKNGKIDIWDFNIKKNRINIKSNNLDIYKFPEYLTEFTVTQLLERVHPQDRKYLESNIRKLRFSDELEVKINFRIVGTNNEEIRWIKATGRVTDFGEDHLPSRCVGVAQDITNYYVNEERLRKSKERLRQASHLAHLGSWEFSAKTQMVELLDGVHEILGISKYEERYLITKRAFIDYAIEVDQNKIREIFNASHKWLQYDEHIFADIGNQRKKLHIIATYKYDRQGNLLNIIGTIQDISEINVLEQALRQAEKMTAVGQLAGGIAHDFNNILMATSGYTELILLKTNQEDIKNYCYKIINSIQRSTDLTRKLLAFSRKDSLIKKPIHLYHCIESALGIISRTIDRNIEVNLFLRADEDIIFADGTEIQNVFINLCLNARDAMPTGGNIEISTENVFLEHENRIINKLELRQGQFVKVVIKDTGQGIEQKHINKIFEPFFTTKEVGKGTGLGLSAAFGTIMSHQGAIEVDSIVNQGTTFSLYLPVFDQNYLETD